MYQLPHYSDALRQFPSAALTAYFASGGGTTNGLNPMATTGNHHPFAAAAAAAAAAVSHNNPFSIDNILAPRPRLPVPLSPYYVSASTSSTQAAADFYCKYHQICFTIKGVRAKILFLVYLSMINVFNC
jgi:hypothetical protein